ncbi:MAG: prolyl oligopeptidase family serine peptidase [Gemmatimonadaceae bacterium]|nr:prolyl oligopeptidase family serine peptidase [Gemmatimonadaceae bacterium]NUS47832.1 prolyl oligopeptidase family serine peptidase [Gemmatimonadaceae bacterium]
MRLRSVAPLLLLAAPLAAQSRRQLTADDYARAERFLGANTVPLVTGLGVRPTWTEDGRLWYRATVPGGSAFFVVDPVRRTRQTLFDQARLAAALATASGGRVDGNRLPFQTFDLAKDGRSITVRLQNRRWSCDLQQYACAPADSSPGAANAPPSSSVSPDGRRAVFIRDNNLWSKNLAGGGETQLTTDGIRDFGYATDNAGWTHSDNPVVTWSPDSRQIATFQHDGRGVRDMYLVSTNVGAPHLQAWKYPMPGDSVIFRISRVIIGDGPDGKPRVVRLQMPPDAHRSTVTDDVNCGGELCDLQWYPDGSHIAFVSSSRDHKSAWVRVADARTGEVRTLFEERMPTQVGDASLAENLWRVLPASNELIWWSQRDDWIHLYLYDLATGRLKNRITTGEGNVDGILRVDEKSRTITFLASGKEAGRDPYFQHLYRIGFDGRGQTLLTPENANHVVSFSPDGRYFVDTYSTPDTPPVTVLRDADGKLVQTLERADVSRLLASGWKPPMPIRMKARDGKTDIYGLMYVPSRLDSTKKYPIINHIYPGPQTGSVGSRSFSPARGDNQALAELGFVVVEIDGMGTPGRSKAFADAYYGRMGDNTLPDQIAGMKELATRYRFIDIDKAAIWGHSGGGFATAAAMFRHPDFFKVGISESGNHDNRNYEDDWGERYQGLLVRTGTNDNYAEEANQTYASKLQGKLFLVHGEMDDNVPVQNTQLVVDALMKANKDFDLLMLPHARHGYGVDANYVMRRRWDYFVRNLQDAEPPHEYQIGRPALVP